MNEMAPLEKWGILLDSTSQDRKKVSKKERKRKKKHRPV